MNETIYALGFFDGVHIGHAALLAQCRRLAAENGLQGVGLWNLTRPAPQTYLTLHGGFDIEVMDKRDRG